MRSNNAGCFTVLVSTFSRLMLLVFWVSRPVAWNAAFSSVIIPCLGFFILPITTLVYVWLLQGAGAIQGIDWLWLLLAFLMDVGSIGASAAANREKLPGGARDS